MTADQMGARGQAVSGAISLVVRLPAHSAVPPPGARVQVTGRLGRVPLRTGVVAQLTARDAAVLEPPALVPASAHAMRVGLRLALADADPDAGALVAGLAVGDESGEPPELRDAMRASGLSHLTAVSGGNVAIVMGAVLLAAGALRLRLWLRVGAAVAALVYFVVLVGPEPSVLRAALMGAIAVGSVLVGGRRAGPSVLSVAVIALVAWSPTLAVSWGFTLSVVATAGLIVLAPIVDERLRGLPWLRTWPSAPRQAVALTVAAQLATLPVLVAMGGAVGWVAVPANLAAMPVVPVITVLGLVAAGVSPVLPIVAAPIATAASWPAAWIVSVAGHAPLLPGSALPWPAGWAGLGLVVGMALCGALGWRFRGSLRGVVRARPLLAGAVAVLVAIVVIAPPGRRAWPPPGWLLVMCDVGQGDALVIRAGEHSAMLVDAGPDPALVDACLTDLGVTEIPLLVLSHFHADHVGGLPGLIGGRSIAEVLLSPLPAPGEGVDLVHEQLAGTGARQHTAVAGDRWEIGSLSIDVLAPRRRIEAGSRPNNASLVLDVTVGGRHVLLTGDIETEGQVAIADELMQRHFNVVKVPHHGSARQARDLPVWAPASIALVSVGEGNDYGQPAEATLSAWRLSGALVLRTDLAGDVAIVDRDGSVGAVARAS